MSSDGVTAVESQNLAATLAEADNVTLLDTWLVGLSSADSGASSESQTVQGFAVTDLECQFTDFQAKWDVDNLNVNTVQVTDFQAKWDTDTLTKNVVTVTDLTEKWKFSSFRRDYS
jgi:hypothetical protein